jgi:two-component system, OmpR family, sensor histidine kinase KdpD
MSVLTSPFFTRPSLAFRARRLPRAVHRGDPAAPAADRKLEVSSAPGEYLAAIGFVGGITLAGWFVPLSYQSFGHIYLLAVFALSLRVGRGPVFVAAVVSALAWNYVFMPPRLSFSVLHFDDALLLGTYLVVALIGGELTARIRAQQRAERLREHRTTVLFHLARALAAARSFDEAVATALRQVDEHFGARTALLLSFDHRRLAAHRAGTFELDDRDRAVAEWAWQHRQEAGKFAAEFASVEALHLPLLRADVAVGVLVVRLPDRVTSLAPAPRELLAGFATQIALLVEREQLRAASEREKLFQESDRLHRTLLDSVSHELKTPLAVLRTGTENWNLDDAAKRGALAAEMRTAMRRLDHLVANLLNQSRLDAASLTPQFDWCEPRDLIGAARRAAGEPLALHPVTTAIPDDLPLFYADASLMEQVIGNLLLNAALHTPAGRPITIRGGLDEATTRVFIAISDRGPGIPAELRDHLFKKFRRGGSVRGTGLGLSIVKGFMLAQGGTVAVENNPEGGATFTVYLPHREPGGVPSDER